MFIKTAARFIKKMPASKLCGKCVKFKKMQLYFMILIDEVKVIYGVESSKSPLQMQK